MATQSDIELYFSGNDAKLLFTAVDEDTSNALNLSGALALQWRLAKKVSAGTPIIQKDLSSGIVITDAVGGIFEVTIAAADTEPLKGEYYHEVRLTNAAGKKVTLAYGVFAITENLIRN